MSGGQGKARVLMMAPPFADNGLASGEEPDGASAPGEESSPEEAKIRQAIAFYKAALRDGPRLAREVMQEGKRHGHAQRTQERARSRLNVQSWPQGFQGKRLIALPSDPAASAARQRRRGKDRKKQERQGNGRRRKRNGGSRKPRNGALVPMR